YGVRATRQRRKRLAWIVAALGRRPWRCVTTRITAGLITIRRLFLGWPRLQRFYRAPSNKFAIVILVPMAPMRLVLWVKDMCNALRRSNDGCAVVELVVRPSFWIIARWGWRPIPNRQSSWIDVTKRVSTDIYIDVKAACEPDRVALDVSPEARVVVAEPVLVQAILRIEVLAGEAQVGERGEGLLLGLAEGAQHQVERDRLRGVGDLLRRAEMVGVYVIYRAVRDQAHEHVIEPDIFVARGAGAGVGLGE